uniref:Uncharacterized protein n=1 Tax=Octopus bimaculoides TaxID=37653 RepID=A0A0L8HJM0_OCTBM
MTLHLKLTKENYITLVSVYAPIFGTDEEETNQFYQQLSHAIVNIAPKYKETSMTTSRNISDTVTKTANNVITFIKTSNQDWFDENNIEINKLIEARKHAHLAKKNAHLERTFPPHSYGTQKRTCPIPYLDFSRKFLISSVLYRSFLGTFQEVLGTFQEVPSSELSSNP